MPDDYGDYPMSMGQCGPCMECDPGWEGAGYCESCQPPMTYDGTYEGTYDGMAPGWQSPLPADAYPSGTCADGSCSMGTPAPDWSMAVPYSHEAFPSEAMPRRFRNPSAAANSENPFSRLPRNSRPTIPAGIRPKGSSKHRSGTE